MPSASPMAGTAQSSGSRRRASRKRRRCWACQADGSGSRRHAQTNRHRPESQGRRCPPAVGYSYDTGLKQQRALHDRPELKSRPMWFAFKRLALGITLILVTSAILLFTDLDRRTGINDRSANNPNRQRTKTLLAKRWNVDLIEYNTVIDVEEAEAGVLGGLRDSGPVEGRGNSGGVHHPQARMAAG